MDTRCRSSSDDRCRRILGWKSRRTEVGVQYTAAKAGIGGLTRKLAYDFGPYGIRVNAVAPTITLTGERVEGLWQQNRKEEKEKVLSSIPLRRLGTPGEVAGAVVFLHLMMTRNGFLPGPDHF